jgi:hypothetical protein
MLLAILNLIFGCLGLIGVIFAVVGLATVFDVQAAPLPAVPADPTKPFDVMKEQSQFLLNECPSYKTAGMAGVGVSVINMILLISSGIGLLKLKKWARNATFIYVVIGFISTVISTGYQFSAVVPATQKYEKERNEKLIALGKPTPPAMAGVTAKIGAGFGAFAEFCTRSSLSVCSLRPQPARRSPARRKTTATAATRSTIWTPIARCAGKPNPMAPMTATTVFAPALAAEPEGA